MTSHRVLNEMDHPSNNTWTLKEKLAMPEVRWAIFKFVLTAFVVASIATSYLLMSFWIWWSMPNFYRHYDDLYEEAWKNKTKCNQNTDKMVVFDCHENIFKIDNTINLREAIRRTLGDFSQGWIPNTLFDCSNENSQCFEWIYSITLDYVFSQPFFTVLSWGSWTFLMFNFLVTRFPAWYWTKVMNQLDKKSPEGVKFLELSSAERRQLISEKLAGGLVLSPSPPRILTPTAPPMEEHKETGPVTADVLGLGDLGDVLNPLPADAAIDDGIRHRPVPRHKRREVASTAPTNAATPREADP